MSEISGYIFRRPACCLLKCLFYVFLKSTTDLVCDLGAVVVAVHVVREHGLDEAEHLHPAQSILKILPELSTQIITQPHPKKISPIF